MKRTNILGRLTEIPTSRVRLKVPGLKPGEKSIGIVPNGIRQWYGLADQLRKENAPKLRRLSTEHSRLGSELQRHLMRTLSGGGCDGSCNKMRARLEEIAREHAAIDKQAALARENFWNLVQLEFPDIGKHEGTLALRRGWKLVLVKPERRSSLFEEFLGGDMIDETFGSGANDQGLGLLVERLMGDTRGRGETHAFPGGTGLEGIFSGGSVIGGSHLAEIFGEDPTPIIMDHIRRGDVANLQAALDKKFGGRLKIKGLEGFEEFMSGKTAAPNGATGTAPGKRRSPFMSIVTLGGLLSRRPASTTPAPNGSGG
jgi:hypothetical protein